MEVAGRLFAEYGFHGLSMEQLADAAGVSKPVLYQHFPSKRDLYDALIREAVQVMTERVKAALDGTQDNRDRIEGALAAYFDFVGDDRFRLLFSTADRNDEGVRSTIEDALHRVAEHVATLIASDAGLDRPQALLLATALRSLATRGAAFWLEHSELPRDEAVRLLAQLAWRGLGSFDTAETVAPDTAGAPVAVGPPERYRA